MPSISSDLDRTIESLDSLLQARRAREAATFATLQRAVLRLDVPFGQGDAEPEPSGRDERRAEPPRRATTPAVESPPFVPLPRRTTRGGEFGPAVRAKLTAEALEKGAW